MENNHLTGVVQTVAPCLHRQETGLGLIFTDDAGLRWMVMIRGTNYRISPDDVVEVIDTEVLWIPAAYHHDGQRFEVMGHLHPVSDKKGPVQ